MELDRAYAQLRARLIDLAGDLDDTTLRTTVPACPDWTIKDLYGHLAGVVTDALDGFTEPMGSSEMTARQVQQRTEDDIAAVCEEWQRRGHEFDPLLAQRDALVVVFIDAWHHEQDIRAALGRAVDRDTATLRYLAETTVGLLNTEWPEARAAIALHANDDGHWQLGTGPTRATLHAPLYDLVRVLMGRRSRAQMLRYQWEGDPTPHLEHVSAMPPPRHDLVELRRNARTRATHATAASPDNTSNSHGSEALPP